MTIPTWLADRRTIHARAVRPTTCRHCGAPTLTGLDNDRAALTATVDPTPVGPATELRALLAGRASYDLIGHELHHRHHWRLRGHRRWDVVVDHGCGRQGWGGSPLGTSPDPAQSGFVSPCDSNVAQRGGDW